MIDRHPPYDEQECRLGKAIWSVPHLVQLAKDLPVMEVPLTHLTTLWRLEANWSEIAGHILAVNEADLSYPIILDYEGEIMDGRHRLMKAVVTGETTIKAVRFKKNPAPCRWASD